MKNEDLDVFQSGALHFTVLGAGAASRVGIEFRWMVTSFQISLSSVSFCNSGDALRISLPLVPPRESSTSKAEPTSNTPDAAAVSTWHPPRSFDFCTETELIRFLVLPTA